jgi:enoyl-CoA hydratase/carnithine racemase
MTEIDYELFAIRYASREARRSDHFIGGDPHDGPMPMDYFMWPARGGGRTFVKGPNFSQGGDVLDFLEKNTNQFRTFTAECNQSFRAIEALQVPTVAAVRGAAFGGAFELALACDFIVAAEDAVFRCIEASVGSAPVAGAVQRLAERIGRSRAARYAMLCEPMSGVTAGQLGIATF